MSKHTCKNPSAPRYCRSLPNVFPCQPPFQVLACPLCLSVALTRLRCFHIFSSAECGHINLFYFMWRWPSGTQELCIRNTRNFQGWLWGTLDLEGGRIDFCFFNSLLLQPLGFSSSVFVVINIPAYTHMILQGLVGRCSPGFSPPLPSPPGLNS